MLDRLDEYSKEYDLTREDERWLMLDTDHWVESSHVPNFAHVCAEAPKKGFQLAHSNPCFEIWLLLHVRALDAGEQFSTCADVLRP